MNALRRHGPLVVLVLLSLVFAVLCGVCVKYVDGMVVTGS